MVAQLLVRPLETRRRRQLQQIEAGEKVVPKISHVLQCNRDSLDQRT